MPLYANGRDLIRKNLAALQAGERTPRVVVGRLTKSQIEAVNAQQAEQGLPLSIDELVFVGRHIFQRRMMGDGYTIDDVLIQIESALSEESVVIANEYMTAIKNPGARPDRLGNFVHDEVILECSRYRPNPDVFSVIPKGDKIKPKKEGVAPGDPSL
ncbi:MAG: hypothetical protein ABR987_12370 [Terracidiphilus sp.]|jgi:hypothetical protein